MKTITLVRRSDGLVSSVFDVTGWMPIYHPERADDETLAEWVAR